MPAAPCTAMVLSLWMQATNSALALCIGFRWWSTHLVCSHLVEMRSEPAEIRFYATDSVVDSNAAPIVYWGIFPAMVAGMQLVASACAVISCKEFTMACTRAAAWEMAVCLAYFKGHGNRIFPQQNRCIT